MNTIMEFPDTPEQFLDMYGFTDTEEYYTNGQRCITLHRVGQMLEHYFPERTCRDEFNGKAWCFKCDICGCAMPWKDSFSSKTITDLPLHYCPSCGAKVIDKVVEE